MNNSPKYYFLKAIEQALHLDRENSHIEFIEYIDDQMAGERPKFKRGGESCIWRHIGLNG